MSSERRALLARVRAAASHLRDRETRAVLRLGVTAARSTRRRPADARFHCPCCSGTAFETIPVLWPELIAAWDLSPREVDYIDRSQGFTCSTCGSGMRSMALAHAVMAKLDFSLPFSALSFRHPLLRILEVNRAGSLTQFLRPFSGHVLGEYPAVDMLRLPYDDRSFDIVVHSDTLEHVTDPRRALSECLRVTRSGGFVAFTTPIVHGRLTHSRLGLPDSFHGYQDHAEPDLKVETEFGADVWAAVLEAGAASCEFVSLEFPAGVAVVAEPPSAR